MAFVSKKVGLELAAAPALRSKSLTSSGSAKRRPSSTSDNFAMEPAQEAGAGLETAPADTDRSQVMTRTDAPFSLTSVSTSSGGAKAEDGTSSSSELTQVSTSIAQEENVCPGSEDTEHKSDVVSNSDSREEDREDISQGSPTPRKLKVPHDCVFKRLTSTHKTSPRCRKAGTLEEQLGEDKANKNNEDSTPGISSKTNITDGTGQRPAVVRSSFSAAKRRERYQGMCVGFGPREICEINHGISTPFLGKSSEGKGSQSVRNSPRDKVAAFKTSPRKCKESKPHPSRHAFGTTIPSPKTSPRGSKSSQEKNPSQNSMKTQVKKSPRQPGDTPLTRPNVFSPTNLKPWHVSASPLSPGVSELVHSPLHKQSDETVSSSILDLSQCSVKSDNAQDPKQPGQIENGVNSDSTNQEKDVSLSSHGSTSDKTSSEQRPRPASMRERNNMKMDVQKVSINRRKSAPASSSRQILAEASLVQQLSPSAESIKRQITSDLANKKDHRVNHEARLLCKDMMKETDNNKTEKVVMQWERSKVEMSFTRQHLSKSRRPSWGFGGRICPDEDKRCENTKPKNTLMNKRVQHPSAKSSSGLIETKSEAHAAPKNTEAPRDSLLKQSDDVKRGLGVTVQKRLSLNSASSKAQRIERNDRRKSLPGYKASAKESGDGTKAVGMAKTGFEATRSSMADELGSAGTTNRTERLQSLRREHNETIARFRKFMRRHEQFEGVTQITQVTEEHSEHVQECCIRVRSVKEAESLAKTLVESARKGKSPELCLQELTSSFPGGDQRQIFVKSPKIAAPVLSHEKLETGYIDNNEGYTEFKGQRSYDASGVSMCSESSSHYPEENISARTKKPEASHATIQLTGELDYDAPLDEMVIESDSPKVRQLNSQPMLCEPVINHSSQEIESGCRCSNFIDSNNKLFSQHITNLENRGGELVSTIACKTGNSSQSNESSLPSLAAGANIGIIDTGSIDTIAPGCINTSTSPGGNEHFTTVVSNLRGGNKGYHVIQAMSPRSIVPVMIVPGQVPNTDTRLGDRDDAVCLEVTAESTSQPDQSLDVGPEESRDCSIFGSNIEEPDRAGLKTSLGNTNKTDQFVDKKQVSLNNPEPVEVGKSIHRAVSQASPPATRCSTTAESVGRLENPALSVTTMGVSSTATLSSVTTVYSGPYPAPSADRIGKGDPLCCEKDKDNSSFEKMQIASTKSKETSSSCNEMNSVFESFDDQTEDGVRGSMGSAYGRNEQSYNGGALYHRIPVEMETNNNVHVSQGLLNVMDNFTEISPEETQFSDKPQENKRECNGSDLKVFKGQNTPAKNGHAFVTTKSQVDIDPTRVQTMPSSDVERKFMQYGYSSSFELKVVRHATCSPDGKSEYEGELACSNAVQGTTHPLTVEEKSAIHSKNSCSESTEKVVRNNLPKGAYDRDTRKDTGNHQLSEIVQDHKSNIHTQKVQPINKMILNSKHQSHLQQSNDEGKENGKASAASALDVKPTTIAMSIAQKVNAYLSCVTQTNGSLHRAHEQKPPPKEFVPLRSSTFIKRGSGVGSRADCGTNDPEESQDSDVSESNEMSSLASSDESHDVKIKHTASQTMCYKSKDVGTDCPVYREKAQGKDAHENRSGMNDSSVQHLRTHNKVLERVPKNNGVNDEQDLADSDRNAEIMNQGESFPTQHMEEKNGANPNLGIRLQSRTATFIKKEVVGDREPSENTQEHVEDDTQTHVANQPGLCCPSGYQDLEKSFISEQNTTQSDPSPSLKTKIEPLKEGSISSPIKHNIADRYSGVIRSPDSLANATSFGDVDYSPPLCSVNDTAPQECVHTGDQMSEIYSHCSVRKEVRHAAPSLEITNSLESKPNLDTSIQDSISSNPLPTTSHDERSHQRSPRSEKSSKSPGKYPQNPTNAKRSVSAKKTKSQLDIDYLINNLDLSSDSFDSLFLQNAMYLKGADAPSAAKADKVVTGLSQAAAAERSPLNLKRRRSSSNTRRPSRVTGQGQDQHLKVRRLSMLEGHGEGVCRGEELIPSQGAARR